METRTVYHIPHDGSGMPEELMASVCIERERFLQYHRTMRDTGASAFVPPGTPSITVAFGITRLLCDVERFIGSGEVMEQYGMGFCYEKAYDGEIIKEVTDEVRRATRVYYDAHHRRLDATVLDYEGRTEIFDLHSFSSEILMGDTRDEKRELPDVCLGYDDFLPKENLRSYIRSFEKRGFTVAENYPYCGSLIPNAVLSGRNRGEVISCMIEVNKRVYLRKDERMLPGAAAQIRRGVGEASSFGKRR